MSDGHLLKVVSPMRDDGVGLTRVSWNRVLERIYNLYRDLLPIREYSWGIQRVPSRESGNK